MKKVSIIILLILFTAVAVFCDEFGEILRKAEQGHPDAQNKIGTMYYTGTEVTMDYGRAAYWFKRAAEQGHANAQYNLAVMYDKGQGVAQNNKKAEYWYKKAAEKGCAEL